MFEQLDDPEAFRPSGSFRSKVESRAQTLRRQRRNRRIALGCGAAASLSAAVIVQRPNDDSTEIIATDTTGEGSVGPEPTVLTLDTTVPTTTPEVQPAAQNFLIVGSDNRECIDPDSPYAGAFLGDGVDDGSRSDTMMLVRVDPSTGQTSLLSFPRDLWVSVAGSSRKSRINAAFDPQNPKKLIDTIVLNFFVPVDHYVNVDFCGFKDIVDAVGGVAVPFEFATRDKNTGLNIEAPECHAFDGEEALAYVRSRHYQYFDPAKDEWITGGTADDGRITRQQDFVKRIVAKALDRIGGNPLVARDVLDAALPNVITDAGLTVDTMLHLADAMADTDPEAIRQFQIEGRGVQKGNASVIEPALDTPTMQAVLAVFRGDAQLAPPTSADPAADDSSAAAVPTAVADDAMKGIYPPEDPSCR